MRLAAGHSSRCSNRSKCHLHASLRLIIGRQVVCAAFDANHASGAVHSVKMQAVQRSLHSGRLCMDTCQVGWPEYMGNGNCVVANACTWRNECETPIHGADLRFAANGSRNHQLNSSALCSGYFSHSFDQVVAVSG